MASSNASIEIAAGGLVWRKTNTGREILLVHRPGYDDWAFPKGGIEGDEALIECAWREVQEETGFDVVVGRRLPDIEYVKPSGGPKQVSYWAARWVSGAFKPNSEVDRIVWLKTKKAAKQLTYERDRDLLTTLAPDWYRREHRLLLVRHAEAGKRSEWTQDDRLRPLTKQGRKQAKAVSDRPDHLESGSSMPRDRRAAGSSPRREGQDRRRPVGDGRQEGDSGHPVPGAKRDHGDLFTPTGDRDAARSPGDQRPR